MRTQPTYEQLHAALVAGHCPCWVHNVAHTTDIEALRRIAMWHADWNNNVRLQLVEPSKSHDAIRNKQTVPYRTYLKALVTAKPNGAVKRRERLLQKLFDRLTTFIEDAERALEGDGELSVIVSEDCERFKTLLTKLGVETSDATE